MDWHELNSLGDKLREIGHQRRATVEQIFSEVEDGDQQESKQLYEKLTDLSDSAINLMQQQKKIFEDKISQLS